MASRSRVRVAETALASGVGGVDGLGRLPSESDGLQAQRQMIRFMLAGQIAIPENDHVAAAKDCFGVIRSWLKSGSAHGRELGVRQYLNWVRAQTTVADIMVRAAEVETGAADGRRRSNNASRANVRGDITLSVLMELLDEVRAERAKPIGQTKQVTPQDKPAPPLPTSPQPQPQHPTASQPTTQTALVASTSAVAPLNRQPTGPEEEERTRAG